MVRMRQIWSVAVAPAPSTSSSAAASVGMSGRRDLDPDKAAEGWPFDPARDTLATGGQTAYVGLQQMVRTKIRQSGERHGLGRFPYSQIALTRSFGSSSRA